MIVYVSSVLQDKMFQFWFNTFFVPWHMQYKAEEEKRAAVEVWAGNIFNKGNIQACTKGKTLFIMQVKNSPPPPLSLTSSFPLSPPLSFSLFDTAPHCLILSPFDHQCSKTSETSSISSETGDGPPQKIPEPSISAPEEEEENLSDILAPRVNGTRTPGPVTKV